MKKIQKIISTMLMLSIIFTTFSPYIAYAATSSPKKGDLKYDGITAYVNIRDTEVEKKENQYTSTNNQSVEVATGTYHTSTGNKETTIIGRENSDGTYNDVTKSTAKSSDEYLSDFDIEIRKTVTKINDDGKYKVSFQVRGKGVEKTIRKDVYVIVVFDNSNSMAPSQKEKGQCKDWNSDKKRCYDKWDSAQQGAKDFATTLLENIPTAQIALVSFAGGKYTNNTSTCTGIISNNNVINASGYGASFSIGGNNSNRYYYQNNSYTHYPLSEYTCNKTNNNGNCTQIYKTSAEKIIASGQNGFTVNNGNYINNEKSYSQNNYTCVMHDTPWNDSQLVRNFSNENLNNVSIKKPDLEQDVQIGGTNLEAGLLEAQNIFKSNKSIPEDALKYIVVMGDGTPTFYYDNDGYTQGDGNTSSSAEKNPAYTVANSLKNNDIKIYTVGYEISDDSSAKEVLQKIATGTSYFAEGNATGIAKLFTDVAESIIKDAGIHAIVTDKIGSAFTGSGEGVTNDTFTYGPLEKITNRWQSMGSFEIQIDRDSPTGWYPTNDGFKLTYYDNDNVLHTIYCDDNPEVYWKQYELSLKKEVQGFNGATPDTSKPFKFTISAKNSKGKNVTGEYTIESSKTGTSKIKFSNGIANISLYHNESVTIYDLPYLTKYKITENDTDGYEVETLYLNDRKYSDVFGEKELNSNQQITFINTTGYILPETGSAGGLILGIVGSLLLIVPVIYIGYILIRKEKVKG